MTLEALDIWSQQFKIWIVYQNSSRCRGMLFDIEVLLKERSLDEDATGYQEHHQ